MAFATWQDVQDRSLTELTDAQRTAVSVLLEDAGAMLSALVEVNDEDESQAELLRMVSCAMVQRAMASWAADAYGVDELTSTMGPFSQTARYSNPSGNLYLTKQERDLLGVRGTGYVFDFRPSIGGADA